MTYDQPVADLARGLIGARLLVAGVGGTVIETEAYGRTDPASHSFRGPTARNRAMFAGPGHVYVYLSYGCHLCLNVVGRVGEAVLIRAIRPEAGVETMRLRRGGATDRLLCAGPGRVGQALGLTLNDSGLQFGRSAFDLTPGSVDICVMVGTRIGISRATDVPWRFGLFGATGLSRPFPPPSASLRSDPGTIRTAGCFSDRAINRGDNSMPNEPDAAARKRTPPASRKNAQGDAEGSPHGPEAFDALNPAKQVPAAGEGVKKNTE